MLLKKEDLNVVVVDDSKFFCKATEMMLVKCGFKQIKKFQSPMKFLSFFRTNNKRVDIVLIDYRMPEIDGLEVLERVKKIRKNIITVMITMDQEVELKQKAIQKGINDFLSKDVSFPEFKAKMDILSNLRLFQYKEAQKNMELNRILQYKDAQEGKAVSKQLQIIKDELSFHYFDDIAIQSYFKPKDILSGDSYCALNIKREDKMLIVLADAMGKGLSASISAILTISFAVYKVQSLAERNDYIYELFIRNLFEYVKSIMLENEAMCVLAFEYDMVLKKIRYANFGIPPIFMRNSEGEIKRLNTNNLPIMKDGNKKYRIDEFNEDFNTLLLTTDGLIENTDKNGVPYLISLKKIFEKADSLNTIIGDFMDRCDSNDDDVTLFFIKKETENGCKVVLNDKVLLEKEYLKQYTSSLESVFEKGGFNGAILDVLILIISELLMNCYEHGYLKLKEKKQEYLEKGIDIDKKGDGDEYATLMVKSGDKYVTIDVEDNGDGFDVSEFIKKRGKKDRYHGRGVQMISKMSDGMFYNEKGNHIRVFVSLKRFENENR